MSNSIYNDEIEEQFSIIPTNITSHTLGQILKLLSDFYIEDAWLIDVKDNAIVLTRKTYKDDDKDDE